MNIRQYKNHLGLIFDASKEKSSWPFLVDQLTRSFECRVGAILITSTEEPVAVITTEPDKSMQRDYLEYYGKIDPVQNIEFSVDGIFQQENFFQYKKTEFYYEFGQKAGACYRYIYKYDLNATNRIYIGLARDEDQGPLSDARFDDLKMLTHALNFAFESHHNWHILENAEKALSVVLDNRFRVVDFTGTLDKILTVTGLFQFKNNQLVLKNHRDQDKFEFRIQEAISFIQGKMMAYKNRCLCLKNKEGRQFYVHVRPYEKLAPFGFKLNRNCVELVIVPEQHFHLDWDLFQNRYNLSDREVKVLKLVNECRNRREIATEINRGMESVKTYIGKIMDKTETSSQKELIKRLYTESWVPDSSLGA